MAPRLIVFSGLPGVGKTTLARGLARATGAVPIRVDTIEAVLKRRGPLSGPEGYEIAFDLARDYLSLGFDVIADMVNNSQWERVRWRQVAEDGGANMIALEIRCTDQTEHRRRIEARPGPPDWAAVLARPFEPWDAGHLVLDTAGQARSQSLDTLRTLLAGAR